MYNSRVPAPPSFAFDHFELDPARRRLIAGGEPVALSDRHLEVLLLLVAQAGHIVSKDDLMEAGWKDVAVGDNSLEQAISSLRKLLGTPPGGGVYIETVPRRGYRFIASVSRMATRESDETLEALLAPHRAFVEGRAALESLDAAQVLRAREVFEDALQRVPEHSSAHVGLANACVLQFEMTRAGSAPDEAALAKAAQHSREACRLDPQSAEAWATLGLVFDRIGQHVDAVAASKRAVALEPGNWRHSFRLAYVGWGEERLRAAQKTLTLFPEFPLARWLAATVYVARQVPQEAERELDAAFAAAPGDEGKPEGYSRFSAVALHWLRGLLHLAAGDSSQALAEFERELAASQTGHVYATECAANTWYAIGAVHLRHQRSQEAEAAFGRALQYVPVHPMARLGLAIASGRDAAGEPGNAAAAHPSRVNPIDVAIFRAAQVVCSGGSAGSANQLVDAALAAAPPGGAGWLLPVEPLLNVSAAPQAWASALARLRNRAA